MDVLQPSKHTEPTQVVISSTPTVDANCFGANNGSTIIEPSIFYDNGNSYQSGNSFSDYHQTYQTLFRMWMYCNCVNITEPTQVVIVQHQLLMQIGANNGSITINGWRNKSSAVFY
ncbi:MAG: hypothetical protein R2847_07025 [Bacteroidia bacterium]